MNLKPTGIKRIFAAMLVFALSFPFTINTMAEVPESGNDPTQEPKARLLTLSDYQKSLPDHSGDDWVFLQNQLKDIVKGAKDAGADPQYMLFGGDFTINYEDKTASDTGRRQVFQILGQTWPVITPENSLVIQGNHDSANTEGLASAGSHEFDDFIIYVINEDDFTTKQESESVLPDIHKTANDLKNWLDERVEAKETRPILIASHTGLHYDIDRSDGNNQFSYVLFQAINDAAKVLDITFLFGHNHSSGDEQVGGSLNFYQKGQKLNVSTETSSMSGHGTPMTLNFVYMNYGYVGNIGDLTNNPSEFTPTDVLAVSELCFYDDRIVVNRYSKDGLLSDYTREIARDHRIAPEQAVKKCTITYDGNGGNVPVTTDRFYPGKCTVNPEKPVRSGYFFAGYLDDDQTSIDAGDEIDLQKDITLHARWVEIPAGQKYVLTDTLKPGKQYILIYNRALNGNADTKYAVMADGENVKVTELPEAAFLASDRVLWFDQNENTAALTWDVLWNQNASAAKGYLLQNIGDQKYLCHKDKTLSLGADPLGSEYSTSNYCSTTFPEFVWDYRNYNGYDQLAMCGDEGCFINVFLYEKTEEAAYVWKQAAKLESNREYLIVNSAKAGDAFAMTTVGGVIGSTKVKVKKDDKDRACIEMAAGNGHRAVYHTYGLADGTFWLDNWNAPGDRHVIRLDPSAVKVGNNHSNYRSFYRYSYEKGILCAKEGLKGTALRKLTYNGGFKVDSGSDVVLFRKVYDYEADAEQAAYERVLAEEAKNAEGVKKDEDKKAGTAKAAKKGTLITISKLVYRVTDDREKEPAVSVKKATGKKLKKVTIPATITKDGITYKVTSIDKKAFNGCKKLKTISIKSTALKKVGKNAFKGIHKKAVIKVPKDQKREYRKLLKKKGQAKTVRIVTFRLKD